MRAIILFCLALVAGCAEFPELDAAAPGDSGPAPALLPRDRIDAARLPPVRGAPEEALATRARTLAARAAALRARAGGSATDGDAAPMPHEAASGETPVDASLTPPVAPFRSSG